MELLFLDTETGGLNPGVNSLLEVGMVACVDNMIKATSSFTIKEENYVVSPMALNVNKLDLYNDIYLPGISKGAAVNRIMRFCIDHFVDLPILVGHNISIDKYMIRELFNSQGLNMDTYISHRMIDTMSLLHTLYALGKLPKEACSSDGPFKHFNIEVKNLHRALDNAKATAILHAELMQMFHDNMIDCRWQL